MINLLLSAAVAVVTFLLFFLPGIFAATGSAVLGTIGFAAAYFFLARRSMKQLEAILMSAQGDIMGARQGNTLNQARIESGLTKIRSGFALGRWQLFVTGQVHAQLGMILFMLERYDEARPHLEKAFIRIAQARLMLAVLCHRNDDAAGMAKAFEQAVAAEKKNSLTWSTYAWCLEKRGQRDQALAVLARGVKESPSDEKLKENQKALQNGERLRMKPYGQEWWALRLEPMPMEFIPAGMRPQQGFRKGYRQPPKERTR